jgi:hypothetical protein
MYRREARLVVHKGNLRIMFAECQGDRLRNQAIALKTPQ